MSEHSTQPEAVVLLSGGLDSATCLAIARKAGYRCHCLTISYGQRHQAELTAAAAVVESLGAASHKVISIDLRAFGGSALTSDDFEVPKADAGTSEPTESGIPITYVPARNTIFLSYALGLAEVLEAEAIFAGVNAVDYSGYPDCRPEFIQAFQAMAGLATKAGVEGNGPRIETPLLHLTKPQIIQQGLDLGVDYALTHSCYDPVEDEGRFRPCGRCDSCRIRISAFEKLGLADPALSADDCWLFDFSPHPIGPAMPATSSPAARALAHTVRSSAPMLKRFLAGFDDSNRTTQAPGLPNHAAWILGHCALTMGRLSERAGGPSIPSDFFITGSGGDGRKGSESRFDADAVAVGSKPTDEPELWPTLDTCIECFDEAIETLADTIAGASDEDLADSIAWGSAEYPLRDLAIRVSLHNAMHAGQLADLRRALGMPMIMG